MKKCVVVVVTHSIELTQGIKLLKAASLGLSIEVAWLPLIAMVALIIICEGIAVKFFKWR